MSAEDHVAILRCVEFLRDLGEASLAKLASRAVRRRFSRGEPLCREGQSCAGVWIVIEGSIQSVIVSTRGRIQILHTAGAKGTCTLASVLDGGACPAQTEAREDALVLLIPRAAFLEVIEEDPKVGVAIARHLGERLRTTCQLVSLGLRDVRARVAAFLVDEAERSGASLKLPASQEELAHRLGTEREVFARALRSLRDEGTIDQDRGRVSIKDLDRLRTVAEAR